MPYWRLDHSFGATRSKVQELQERLHLEERRLNVLEGVDL